MLNLVQSFPKFSLCISKMIKNSDDEHDIISAILFSYRTAVHSSTNYTPFMLFQQSRGTFAIGHEPRNVR